MSDALRELLIKVRLQTNAAEAEKEIRKSAQVMKSGLAKAADAAAKAKQKSDDAAAKKREREREREEAAIIKSAQKELREKQAAKAKAKAAEDAARVAKEAADAKAHAVENAEWDKAIANAKKNAEKESAATRKKYNDQLLALKKFQDASKKAADKRAADEKKLAEKNKTVWQKATEKVAQEIKDEHEEAAVRVARRWRYASETMGQSFKRQTRALREDLADAFSNMRQNGFGDWIRRNADRAASTIKGMAVGIVPAVAAAGTALVHLTSEAAMELRTQATQLGISTDALQRYRYAAQATGVDADKLTGSLAKLGRRAQDAAQNGGQSAKVFHDLGIELKDSQGNMRTSEELFRDVADRMQNLDPRRRAVVAMSLFEEEGRELVPLLAQGSIGLERLGREFDELGGGLDEQTIQASVDFNREMLKLKQGVMGLVMPVARMLIPGFRWLAEKARLAATKLRELNANTSLLRAGMITLGAIAAVVGAAMLLEFAPMILTLAAIAAGAVAVGLAMDDLLVTFEGGDSIIRRFIDGQMGIGATTDIVNALKAAWSGVVEVMQTLGRVFDAVGQKAGQVWNMIPAPLRNFMKNAAINAIPGVGEMRGAAGGLRELGRAGAGNMAGVAPGFNAAMLSPARASVSPLMSSVGGGTTNTTVAVNAPISLQIPPGMDARSAQALARAVEPQVQRMMDEAARRAVESRIQTAEG